jgi:hypothetical protein
MLLRKDAWYAENCLILLLRNHPLAKGMQPSLFIISTATKQKFDMTIVRKS